MARPRLVHQRVDLVRGHAGEHDLKAEEMVVAVSLMRPTTPPPG
jgi:hypothetical protein